MEDAVHVMVAILRDREGRVLIAQRPAGKSQAGRWEFPGGKLERGEPAEAGLRRELLEELGVVAGPMRRLMEIRHQYPAFAVRLDVRELVNYGGEPLGREGQALRWVMPDALPSADILEADRPIIHALRLTDTLLVTPDPGNMPRQVFLRGLEATLAAGVRLVQLRAPSLGSGDFFELSQQVLPLCRRHGARLLLNADADVLAGTAADGLHLNSRRLRAARRRPVPSGTWLSASCHTLGEVMHARRIAADFILLGPVLPTASHPEARPLGWSGFGRLAERANMPVYALGGLSAKDIERARRAGARGVAAIRGLWQGGLA